ncbi:MAG: YicC domain-containing protein [Candidatus Magnetoglobus multicellularis str. Araruama]|uniref:YicC domain-containing protein n=1 Tax=Candidatus Magnetoglobus multicellularis str. Araruama TaxID=890399 RepID=A0A1V1PFV5_9BACT|nr:MAG: YicC domain-containing protein [Candidatus Magnetoglobus multicellularis str. Araruama]
MITIQETIEEENRFEADLDRATEYISVLEQVIAHFQLQHAVTLRDIMKAGGVIKPLEKENDLEAVEPVLIECLETALKDICAMRATEGEALARDIDNRLNDISQSMQTISTLAHEQVDYYCQKLKDRIASLTHNIIEIDPVRIAQEAAILADRSDISEEITRLDSHIEQFRTLMNENQPVGRKLNFLLQEIGRELNTIGSKSGSAEISKIIVNLKSEHEKIREQIQNIE